MLTLIGWLFIFGVVFGAGFWFGAVFISAGAKSYEQGRYDQQVEDEAAIRRSLVCSAAAHRREAILFDAWRDARDMALAMGNISGRFCEVAKKFDGDPRPVEADFYKLEPEYEAWIATLKVIPKRIEAANLVDQPPSKAS